MLSYTITKATQVLCEDIMMGLQNLSIYGIFYTEASFTVFLQFL